MTSVQENLNSLLTWSSCFGLMPFQNGEERTFKPMKLFSYVVMGGLVFLCFYSMYLHAVSTKDSTLLILHLLAELLMMSANVTTIYGLTFGNIDQLKDIFNIFNSIDLHCAERMIFSKVYVLILILIVNTSQIATLFVYGYNLQLEYVNYREKLMPIIFNRVEEYYTCMSSLFMYFVLRHILYRFRFVNECVINWKTTKSLNNFSKTPQKEENMNLTTLVKLHTNLCDLLDIMNSLFGTPLVLLILYNLTTILWAIYYNLIQNVSPITNILFLYNIFFNGFLQVLVTKMCEDITEEGRLAISNTYKVINNNIYNQEIRESLLVLAQQTTTRSVAISAGGFFDVNFAMLFALFNLSVTYVIAIIQFIPEDVHKSKSS